jgi:hypothetical protein
MNKSVFIFLTVLVSQPLVAQEKEVKIHSATFVGSQSRYEIIQSTLAARWTFRLDKVCGNVGQMVKTKADGITWEPMVIVSLPNCQPDGKNRYQLFTSGLAARHTFLLNTATGKTWQIRATSDDQDPESFVWVPFD